MAGLGDEEERLLWQRWRAGGSIEAHPPNPLDLAAYAEGRLSEIGAERIENWLATHPDALAETLADIDAARGATRTAIIGGSEAIIARACALVPGPQDATDDHKLVQFRRREPRWHNALAWSSVAASLVAASLVGFVMGSDAYRSFSHTQASESAGADSLDASATLDTYFTDESGT